MYTSWVGGHGVVKGIDLFAGAGGMTLGLKAAGVETVCAVEADEYRTRTYARHTPDADIVTADVRRVGFAKYRGRVELVYGGPPCQPFSSGGLRRSHADARNMIPEFLRVVGEVRPAAVVMENVPGLVVGDRFKYLATVVGDFEDLGYRVAWRVVNAAEYGVPQKRRRLFVVGLRDATFEFPEPTHGPGRDEPFIRVRDVLPPDRLGEPNPARVFYAKNPDLRPSPYDGHLFNGGGRPINLDEPCHTILASAGGNKTHFLDTLGLVPEYHHHLCGGGTARAGTLPGGRRLTVRESALIQTFPADLEFCGPKSAQYQQVGDAVPPRLAAVLGRALLPYLDGRHRDLPPVTRPVRQRTLF